MTNPTRQIGEAVERAARVVEHFRTRAYGWSAEQFEVWFTEDPLFCQKVNEWGGFRGTEKQKLLHETRLALEAAMPNTSQPGTEERSDEVKPKASDLSTITRQRDEAVRLALANVYFALDCVSSPEGGEAQTRLERAVTVLEAMRDGREPPSASSPLGIDEVDEPNFLATVEDKP